MKRTVTHLLVATGLVIGAVGAAQAHTNVNIGLGLGTLAYAAPVYARPAAPEYRARYWRHQEPRWGNDRGHDNNGRWNRAGWDHGHSNGWGRRG